MYSASCILCKKSLPTSRFQRFFKNLFLLRNFLLNFYVLVCDPSQLTFCSMCEVESIRGFFSYILYLSPTLALFVQKAFFSTH